MKTLCYKQSTNQQITLNTNLLLYLEFMVNKKNIEMFIFVNIYDIFS